jgi:hypothetical protein
MGEARRRRLAGICLPQPRPLRRVDAIAWAMGFLAATEEARLVARQRN